jgi:hypothetical protein
VIHGCDKQKKNRDTSTIKLYKMHILNDFSYRGKRGKKAAYEANPSPSNSPGRLVKINCTALIFLAASMLFFETEYEPFGLIPRAIYSK